MIYLKNSKACVTKHSEELVGDVARGGRKGLVLIRPNRVYFGVWIFSKCNGRLLPSFGKRVTWYDIQFSELFLAAV